MAERFGIFCAADDWAGPARTARALTRCGAEVCIVAPPQSYAAQTRFKAADILMPFDEANRKLPSIMRTLAEDFGAHSILAGDDTAFAALALLTARMDELSLSAAARALLARSMPNASAATLIASDSEFIIAQAGIRCPPPPSIANPSVSIALEYSARVGFPVAVKRNGFSNGAGVSLCEDQAQLQDALMNGSASARDNGFVVQKYVRGTVYGVTVSGVEGKALAAFSFIKHKVAPAPHGATSVARYDNRPDILENSRELFEVYKLNGYAGFDYVVDETERAFLIEINPRIMPTGHFAESFGNDLTAAILAHLRRLPIAAPRTPTHEYVALFPNEWAHEPSSPYLQTAFHDAPWDDPLVLSAMIDRSILTDASSPMKTSLRA